MPIVEWLALAFLTGITVFGVFGSLIELVVGQRLSFSPPFVTTAHPMRLVAGSLLAGPMMLLNDALEARRAGRVSVAQFLGCAATCLVWTCAMGVAMLEGFASKA